MSHPDPDLLSLYLDADLSGEEATALEAHLAACEKCRTLLGELDQVRRGARALPDVLPPRDLWPEIARSLRSPASSQPEVIPLHPSASPSLPVPGRRRGFRLSYAQAAAAGVALVLLSGLAGAALTRGTGAPEVAEVPREQGWIQQVGQASPELEGSAREVARLEELLERHQGELDPATVRILEKSLGVIDQAIRESLAALELDPGNRFLRDHLQRSLLAKAEYLRDATILVAPAS